jgi:hypothetical protein
MRGLRTDGEIRSSVASRKHSGQSFLGSVIRFARLLGWSVKHLICSKPVPEEPFETDILSEV